MRKFPNIWKNSGKIKLIKKSDITKAAEMAAFAYYGRNGRFKESPTPIID